MSYSDMRITKLRAVMKQLEADAFLVRNQSNIRWLTGFDDVFDGEQAHAVLVTADEVLLHTDTRYDEALRRAAQGTSIAIDAAEKTHVAFVKDALLGEGAGESAHGVSDAPRVRTLAIETTLYLSEFRNIERAFEDAPIELLETKEVILGLREVKDADEIARMRKAQAITDAAFAHIVGFMKRGMTEREIQLELEDFMVRNGAGGLAFSSIVATGANGASPHAIPGATVLEEGHAVVLDFGALALDYCSDMTRMVFVGEPDEKVKQAYRTLRRANEEVEAMIAPGVTGREAHQRAEEILAEGGFAGKMGHSLGHGVGIDIHEEPVLALRNTEPLVPGNVVTVEPGIYLAGEFGMRLEDFGVVTEDGFDVFTQSSHEMVII